MFCKFLKEITINQSEHGIGKFSISFDRVQKASFELRSAAQKKERSRGWGVKKFILLPWNLT